MQLYNQAFLLLIFKVKFSSFIISLSSSLAQLIYLLLANKSESNIIDEVISIKKNILRHPPNPRHKLHCHEVYLSQLLFSFLMFFCFFFWNLLELTKWCRSVHTE